MIATAGSRNYLQWKTLKSHKSSNCTVRISTGSELSQDFKTLRPRDNTADHNGFFPCGRTPGFDGKEFKLPNDMTCAHCIVSFT